MIVIGEIGTPERYVVYLEIDLKSFQGLLVFVLEESTQFARCGYQLFSINNKTRRSMAKAALYSLD